MMKRARFAWVLAAVAFAAACNTNDPVDPNVPKSLAIVDGTPQTNAVGSVAVAPLRVTVKNGDGKGVEGVMVTWAVAQGGGSVSPGTSVTNFDGVAQTTFTFGSSPGTSIVQAIVAAVSGSPQNFTMNATALPGGGGGGAQ